MALVDLPSPLFFPRSDPFTNAALARSSSPLGTIGYGFGIVMTAPITDVITKVGFFTNAINTSTIEVRVETVDLSTGVNSGTLWAANTNFVRSTNTSEDAAYLEVTLTSGANVNAGDLFAIVVVMNTSSAGSCFTGVTNTIWKPTVPYGIVKSTGTWSILTTMSPISVCFSSAGYIPLLPILPISAVNTHTFNNTSTPDVYGNIINLPYKCKVDAAWFQADLDGDLGIKLFDSDGVTVLASASNGLNVPLTTGGSKNVVYFNSEVTLNANTNYYLGLEPSTGTSLSLYSLDFPNSDVKKNFVDSSAQYVTAKDPSGVGSWTTTSTRILMAGVQIKSIDSGAQGTIQSRVFTGQ
jgi:hypothetical protein